MVMIIIGAGASGLVAAIMIARAGLSVKVYEKNKKIGKKILATGNGRCNVTNQNIELSNFHGSNPSFANYSLKYFNTDTCKKFFMELGIELIEGKKGRLYPRSMQSASIVELLKHECERLKVDFLLEQEVLDIDKKRDNFSLSLNGHKVSASKVLIATGGLAMPILGGNDSGYKLAKKFNHNIVPTSASLVQVLCKEDLKPIAGVKIEGNIEVYENGRNKAFSNGDILFTNYGISGSAVLDISRVISRALLYQKELHVVIDLVPEYSKDTLRDIMQKRLKHRNGKNLALWLDGFINPKLAKFMQSSLQINNIDKINAKELNKIVYALKNLILHVDGTKGFKTAEVTAGGIDTDEVNPKTMESRLKKGLFFSGEVLDIDGDCGGYNLHWAWASGMSAGLAMTKRSLS